MPWRAVPVMPVEIMLLPRWFPFHLAKVSYWARTVLVPLLVLQALKPRPKNPRGVGIAELFADAARPGARLAAGAAPERWPWAQIFGAIDAVLQRAEPLFPSGSRRRAIAAAAAFVDERLNGRDGLGAIFPAMANAVLMYDALGYPPDHPNLVAARQSLDGLLVVREDEAYCQPCLSPVWDTALACHALLEAGGEAAERQARRGLDWLAAEAGARHPRRLGRAASRRAAGRLGLPIRQPALSRPRRHRRCRHGHEPGAGRACRRRTPPPSPSRSRAGASGSTGLQSRDGGWAAFDADNTAEYLNNIPFADHGALLDPPTADVTARCISMLAQLGETRRNEPGACARRRNTSSTDQDADGSWFGRWGMNYIYGTWSALCALNAAGIDPQSPADAPRRRLARRASRTRTAAGARTARATSSTMPATSRPRAPLRRPPGRCSASWPPARSTIRPWRAASPICRARKARTASGRRSASPRPASRASSILRYHGYAKFFPLWALARYRNLKRGNSRAVPFGM